MSMNTDEMLDRLIGLAGEHATNILIKQGMDLVPTWTLIDADKQLEIIATPWADLTERDMTRATMRFYMTVNKIAVYSFVTEAWSARVSEKEYENPMGFVRPSDHVNRQEVVIACAAACDGSTKWARWAMERNAEGKVTALVSEPMLSEDGGEKPDSWIGEMLK